MASTTIKKPDSPIVDEISGYGFYPLTSYDQIVLSDGSRWDGGTSLTNYLNSIVSTIQTSSLIKVVIGLDDWSSISSSSGWNYTANSSNYTVWNGESFAAYGNFDSNSFKFLTGFTIEQVNNSSTSAILSEGLNAINSGYSSVSEASSGIGNGFNFWVSEKPSSDLEILFLGYIKPSSTN